MFPGDEENKAKKETEWRTVGSGRQAGAAAAPSSFLQTLPLTVGDKWPLKSHDHLIHLSLAISCALTLLAVAYYRRRNSPASIKTWLLMRSVESKRNLNTKRLFTE